MISTSVVIGERLRPRLRCLRAATLVTADWRRKGRRGAARPWNLPPRRPRSRSCKIPLGTAMPRHAIGLTLALTALLPVPVSAQDEEASLAYPNLAFTFTAAYVAEDIGLFAKHGLKLKPLSISGPGSTNAVISGSADFALASASVQTRAAARGQRLLSIANPTDRPIVQIIMRKDLVPANFNPTMSLADRTRLLRGRTIAVDAIGSILHGFPLMLAKRAGFAASEIHISPMAPPTALAAFQSKQIDGFAMSMPWPVAPVLEGTATL